MDLSSLGADSCGVWTRRQAQHLLTDGQIDSRVRAGTWQVAWRGVYADAGHVLDAEQRAWAAVLAAGGAGQGARGPDGRRRLRAAAGGRTAARVHGLPLLDDDGLAEDVLVATRTDGRHLGRRVLHTYEKVLTGRHLQRLPSGLWLTRPGRTLADLATLLPPEALVCAVDAALHRGVVTRTTCAALAEELAGRPGAPALRAAVGLADGRSESPAETLARLLLLPALPALQPQVQVHDRSGRVVARVDLGDPVARFAVEADGKRAHAGPLMVARDRERDRSTGALGWHTERVTWADLRFRPVATRRRVLEAYALHLRRAA